MSGWIRNLIKLTFCQVSPEVLPYSPRLLRGFVFFNIAWQFIQVLPTFGPAWGAIIAITPIVMAAWILRTYLRAQGMLNRFTKLFLAIQGVNFVLLLLAFAIVNTMPQMIPVAGVLLTAWELVVLTHICRFGLEVSRVRALFTVLPYLFLVYFATYVVLVIFYPLIPLPPALLSSTGGTP